MGSKRGDTTRSLSDMVEARLRGKSYWASEVLLDGADSRSNRVDYMAFRLSGTYGIITPHAMELLRFECYEVKSCMADFESGHGLNFVGDENYLVCERDLADRLYEEMKIPDRCAVLCPNKPRTALVKAYEKPSPWLPRRTKSTSELMLSMVVSGIVRPSEQRIGD